jgi:hypothetical protein
MVENRVRLKPLYTWLMDGRKQGEVEAPLHMADGW